MSYLVCSGGTRLHHHFFGTPVLSFQDRLQQSIDADYQIERELGGGGMSRVFVATERALQRRVVIKVLPPELSAGVNVDRFRREIQLAAQLQHPHIVPLLATGDKSKVVRYRAAMLLAVATQAPT